MKIKQTIEVGNNVTDSMKIRFVLIEDACRKEVAL